MHNLSLAMPHTAPTFEPSTHYENFPVGSWLVPSRKRPIVHAIYRFARFADDLADEGSFSASVRIDALETLKLALNADQTTEAALAKSSLLTANLAQVLSIVEDIKKHVLVGTPNLYKPYLVALLNAFIQDAANSAQSPAPPHPMFTDQAALLAYCEKSANPVGRMMLLIFDCHRPELLAYSDAICSGLQWINFMQDVSVDVDKGRIYCPNDDLISMALSSDVPLLPSSSVILKQTIRARALLLSGKPLAAAVPLRLSLELRAILSGGLCLADKIIAANGATQHFRPKLTKSDALKLCWRFLYVA
jgi:hydroxysqualene synthase